MKNKPLILALALTAALAHAGLVRADDPPADGDQTDASAVISSDQDNNNAQISDNGDINIEIADNEARVTKGSAIVERLSLDESGNGSGWIGSVAMDGSDLDFTPTGRPLLRCPAQGSGVYGPCRLPTNS